MHIQDLNNRQVIVNCLYCKHRERDLPDEILSQGGYCKHNDKTVRPWHYCYDGEFDYANMTKQEEADNYVRLQQAISEQAAQRETASDNKDAATAENGNSKLATAIIDKMLQL